MGAIFVSIGDVDKNNSRVVMGAEGGSGWMRRHLTERLDETPLLREAELWV